MRFAVSLQKYPRSHRAALAINNDTDGMDWRSFRDWHDYVNGTGETHYGKGLGLEVSDSFWHWSDSHRFALYHNSPDEIPKRSPEYEFISEMARLGWLDTLHGFGSWNRPYHAERKALLTALEEMEGLGIRPKIYVNHGGGKHMSHNLGGVWATYQQADDPNSPSYCLDQLIKSGFRYFWWDNLYESDKFGNESNWPDQKARETALKVYDAKRFTNARTGDRTRNLELACAALGVADEAGLRAAVFDESFLPTTMRDGNKVLGFKRFRGEYPPDAGSFAHQVNAARLDDLVRREAVVVVYQHFGIWRALSSPPKNWASWRYSRVPVLDEHCVWAFRFLAERQARGEIFITTTQRLLDYLRMRDHLDYELRNEGSRLHVTLRRIACPIYGEGPARAADVQGLTFSVDGTPETVTMSDSDGRTVPLERLAGPAAEASARQADQPLFWVPWQRLSYPF